MDYGRTLDNTWTFNIDIGIRDGQEKKRKEKNKKKKKINEMLATQKYKFYSLDGMGQSRRNATAFYL